MDPDAHVRTVERDYDRRTGEWRSIYDGTSFHDHLIRERLRRALAMIDREPATGAALDVGCGAGQLVAELAARGYKAHGCDVAAGMVATASELLAERGLSAEVRQGSLPHLPYDDAAFALVTGLGLIEYLPDPVAAVAELARLVAPGGRLVVTTPNPLRLGYLADPVGVLRGALRTPQGGYRRHYLTAKQLRRAVERTGMEVADLEGHGLGPVAVGGRPVLNDERTIALSDRLEGRLSRRAVDRLGSNLIALAVKQPAVNGH